MEKEAVSTSRGVDLFETNLKQVARVIEWVELIGYKISKYFSKSSTATMR